MISARRSACKNSSRTSGMFLGLAGDDLSVIRIIALDQFRGPAHGNPLSSWSANDAWFSPKLDFHVALVLQQPVHFIHGLGGHDEFAAAFFGDVHFLVHKRDRRPGGTSVILPSLRLMKIPLRT